LEERVRGRADGKRVALITNDQAPNLVDTELLRRQGLAVSEVSGRCFCCRFDQLVGSIETLVDSERPELILAEPVGSCTDLSATVIQPWKRLYSKTVEVAPFTVLADPERLVEAFSVGNSRKLADSVYYIV
jgi:G3E family GTPase